MPFLVVPRDDKSLQKLLRIDAKGGAVLRTAHVGNMYPSNLAVLAIGFRAELVDHNIGLRDTNYHPHCVIRGGVAEQIAPPDLFTLHARVTQTPTQAAERFPLGARVLDSHLQALRDALPRARFETCSAYHRAHVDLVVPVLELVTETCPRVWDRRVRDGRPINDCAAPSAWAEVAAAGVSGLSETPDGWVIPNVVNILLDGIVECCTREVREVWELSGPDMIRYAPALAPQLTELYDHVRARWGRRDLPETLTLNIVPTADLRFVVRGDRRERLNALVDALLLQEEGMRRRSWRIQRAGCHVPYEELWGWGFYRERWEEAEQIKNALAAVPEILYDIGDATFFTQYDLLAQPNAGLYVHPWAVSRRPRMLKETIRYLRRLHSRAPRPSPPEFRPRSTSTRGARRRRRKGISHPSERPLLSNGVERAGVTCELPRQ